jgi:hypothetical protein
MSFPNKYNFSGNRDAVFFFLIIVLFFTIQNRVVDLRCRLDEGAGRMHGDICATMLKPAPEALKDIDFK